MADKKGLRWAKTTPPQKSERWNPSWDRPMPSPYPFPHTDPWFTKSVLSIDGGGIRGYSSLVIMQALMEKIEKIERGRDRNATSSIYSSALDPLDFETCAAPTPSTVPIAGYWPCHYFDYIAGVGTGGIVAVLLGRYRMRVREAMEKYRDICAMIVERQLTSPQRGHRRREPVLLTNLKMSGRSDARTAKLVPAWPSPHEHERNLESDPKRCRTIVCGCGSKLQPFRSYPGPEPPRHAINDVMLGCVRPSPLPGGYPNAEYYYSNPSRTVLTEVSSLCKYKALGDNGIDLLSIGVGIHEPANATADELQFRMSKQIQLVHNELSKLPRRFSLNEYCRIDPIDHTLDNIGVNEFRSSPSTLRHIEEATKNYLQNEKTAKDLHDFATALVDKRRRRAKTLQWERWALGSIYRCPMFKCAGWHQRFEDRDAFWAHLCEKHGMRYARDDETKRRAYEVYEAMGRTREGGRT